MLQYTIYIYILYTIYYYILVYTIKLHENHEAPFTLRNRTPTLAQVDSPHQVQHLLDPALLPQKTESNSLNEASTTCM